MSANDIRRKHRGKYTPSKGAYVGKSSTGIRLPPASSAALPSPQPFPYHVLVALHVHLKVPYVTLQAGGYPFLGFSCQHVNIEAAVVLHAVVPRVHRVGQGAPGVRFLGFLSAIKQGRVNLQARRDAALQDTQAVLHSGHSSNQRPERNRAPAPGPDRQIRALLRLGNECDLELMPATSSISQGLSQVERPAFFPRL